MNISVIQDREVFRYDGRYYRKDLLELEKYLKLCDHLTYCCSVKDIMYEQAQKEEEIDTSKVTIVELERKRISVPKSNKKIVRNVILNSDLVFVKMPSLTVGRYALHLLKKYNVRYVTEVIGDAFDIYWYYNLKGKLLSIPSYLISRYYIARSDNVIYVTDSFLQKRYPTKGLSLSCSNVRIDITEKKETACSDGTVMKIGTISPVDRVFRGHDTVLKAISLLKKRGLTIKYFLVGGGDPKRLKEQAGKLAIADHVVFLGSLTHEEVMSFLDTIDIYVHPSKAEGLPRSLIEAMSSGKLSIGARTAGIPELLSDEYIFDKGDYHELSRIIERVNKEDLRVQGNLNWIKSQQFEKSVLDAKRKNFVTKITDNDT